MTHIRTSKFNKMKFFTSKLCIRWHKFNNCLVPTMLIVTESLSASSNFTVAAEWKTIDTFFIRVFWSDSEMPSSCSVTSPATGIIFESSFGASRRNFSNSCQHFNTLILVFRKTTFVYKLFVSDLSRNYSVQRERDRFDQSKLLDISSLRRNTMN